MKRLSAIWFYTLVFSQVVCIQENHHLFTKISQSFPPLLISFVGYQNWCYYNVQGWHVFCDKPVISFTLPESLLQWLSRGLHFRGYFFNFPSTLWTLCDKISFTNISDINWIQWDTFSYQSTIWSNCWWKTSDLTNRKDLRFCTSNAVLKTEVFLKVYCSPRSKTHFFFLLLHFQLPAHFSYKKT